MKKGKPGPGATKDNNRISSRILAISRQTWVIAGALAILGFWIYYPAINGTWIGDDTLLISQNSVVHDSSGLWKIWFAPSQVDYFPLLTSVDWLLWQIFGNHALVFHLVNVLLHIACGLLLWRLLAQLGVRLAWLGGLLWVVHPLAVESVAQAAELKNTLSQFFALLALMCFVVWSDSRTVEKATNRKKKRRVYIVSLMLFVAAMLCKSSVVMLPLVLLLYVWWKRGKLDRNSIEVTAPFLAAALVLGLVTVWYQMTQGIGDEFVPGGGIATRIARAGLAIGYYLWKSVVPVNLMPMNPRWPVEHPTLLQFLPWPALAAGLAWLWVKRATWGRHVLLGFGFFLLNLLPVLGFVTMAYMWITWTADHFAYLSLLGIVGLAAAGADAAWFRWEKFHAIFAVAATVLVGWLAWSAHDYDRVFHDEESLNLRAVQANPDAWVAHLTLAEMYSQEHRLKEMQDHYNAAVDIQHQAISANPADPVAYYQLGLLMKEQNRVDDAYAQFKQAVLLKPDYVGAHANLGFIMYQIGRVEDAKNEFTLALRFGNNSAEIRYDLGYILSKQGQYAQALPHLQQAIALKPDYAEAHYTLAQTYLLLNRPADALGEYEAALALRPDNAALRDLVNKLKQSTGQKKS